MQEDQAVLVLLILSQPKERLARSTDFLLVVEGMVDRTNLRYKQLAVLLVVVLVVITLCFPEKGIKDFLVEHQSIATVVAVVGLLAWA